MPELPEVEVVRRGLEPLLTGRTIEHVQVLHPRPVRSHLPGPDDFSSTLVGRQIVGASRRGKYLWFPLSDGDAITAHLGMSGQFRSDDPSAPLQRNTRILFDLDDGRQIRFVDQRMFGGMGISREGAELPPEISHIAPDPFEASFDPVAVAHRMVQRRSEVKRALLDQRLVSGIGNIYADETLWRAKLDGRTSCDRLSVHKATDLLRVAREVMLEALDQGGTSFDALYVNVNGSSGYFGRSLNAYGREGLPCLRCGTTMVREQFTNRSSFRCPRCQLLKE